MIIAVERENPNWKAQWDKRSTMNCRKRNTLIKLWEL
jgi:hypothetical protein